MQCNIDLTCSALKDIMPKKPMPQKLEKVAN